MIRLAAEPFDPYAAIQAFAESCAGAGAVASFIGLVRLTSVPPLEKGGRGGDQPQPPAPAEPPERDRVLAIRLEHHPVLTVEMIAAAAGVAVRRWSLIDALIIHRVGEIAVGAPVVLVAMAAVHRREAFAACDHLMDYLKTEAPFWKKEITTAGERWIEPTERDYMDAARWRAAE